MPHYPAARAATGGSVSDTSVSRRRFVQGLALGGAALGLGLPRSTLAAPSRIATPGVMRGTEFDLVIGAGLADFTGRARAAITVNGSLPAPLLRMREGDHVTLRVKNELPHTTSIHWHGILLPNGMDGVPGMSFDGIQPGETFTYRFPLRQSGTYWYHGHSGMQELLGLYGALVIEPKAPEPFHVDREHVLLLSDWSDDNPLQIFTNLKKQSDFYNLQQPTVGDFFRDVRAKGWRAAVADRKMWGEMRMNPSDLSDVSASTFTYLINGVTPAGNWTGLFAPGEKVRLRFINGAAMTYFDLRIPGLKMTVVAADGQYVEPVRIEEFRLGSGETLDVIVEPGAQPAYTIFAQNMDRSGFARATLALQNGLAAPVPALDARPLLTMADMGHGGHSGHAGHDRAAHSAGEHAGHDAAPPAASTPAVQGGSEHAGHDMAAAAASTDTHDHATMQHDGVAHDGAEHDGAEHDMSAGDMAGMAGMAGMSHAGHDMAGMDHAAPAEHDMSAMDHSGMNHAGMNHSEMAGMDHSAQEGHDMSSMQAASPAAPGAGAHAGHQATTPAAAGAHSGHGSSTGATAQTHPASEANNPGVDMQAMSPSPRLDDPGVGLRDNGRRVLTYADLKSTFPDPDGRAPQREIELHLTGNMERYIWSLDGIPFSEATPIRFTYGERVRLILVNDTMMEHPFHLHGMWSDLEDEQGNFKVRKHTISMPPGTRRSYRVSADALGRWAYHCHLLFHMAGGMMREVRVEQGGA